MSEETLKGEIEAVITKLLEKPKTLGERHRRYWNEIESRYYNFDKRETNLSILIISHSGENQAEILKLLTKDDMLDFFDRKIKNNAPERRLVAIYVHGNTDSKDSRVSEQQNGELKHNYVRFRQVLYKTIVLARNQLHGEYPCSSIDVPSPEAEDFNSSHGKEPSSIDNCF